MINQTETLNEIIVGRVEPHIYAFTTNTIPNYLKVGDTYRPVAVRLREWETYFPNLSKEYEGSAKINNDYYFRDFSVHRFLELEKNRIRLKITDLPDSIYYSNEFFKDATVNDVEDAIIDIQNDYANRTQKYQFYKAIGKLPEVREYPRTETYPLRPNQQKTVDNFKTAISSGRTKLLMYAVMRFGKSFTSMCCAVEMGAKLVVVVSAKADVKDEWRKTVQSHVRFEGYKFISSDDLKANNHIITDIFAESKKVVAFLTLQDLQGSTIKDRHREIFGQKIDLLLVDETHFGARAEKYGEVLKADKYVKDVSCNKDNQDFVETSEAEEEIKKLSAKVTIHLSGTPYRILKENEFKDEDIIAFYQFTDIVEEQEKWDKNNNKKPENEQQEEWENPYYGFPQMIRFAFNPNESARKKLEQLKKDGITYAFSALLKPLSIKKNDNGLHKKFEYEQEVLDLLEVIDGSKEDDEVLGFLDYDKIKQGKMCRHIVIVLPYCASCDAMEALISNNKDKFKNLCDYEIVNISGVENTNTYRSPKDIKNKIESLENQGKKTITLTVNRMLTGSTVPEWDTMIYLKDTASAQEYDQAIFRLQNQYVKVYESEDKKVIKYNMKPQTLLVDFDPNRMFVMQEQKSKIYNANVDIGGNTELKNRLIKELRISPIIAINKNKVVRVEANNILDVINAYHRNKGIMEEAQELKVDLSILNNAEIRAVIEQENEIGSKSGLSTPAHKGQNDDEGTDLDTPAGTGNSDEEDTPQTPATTSANTPSEADTITSLIKKVQAHYSRILLFAYLTKSKIISLSEIIDSLEEDDNARIAHHLGLDKHVLKLLNENISSFKLSDLDYSIQRLNELSHNDAASPEEKAAVAIRKFGKLGDAVVITPSNICDDMVNLFPDDFIKGLPECNGRILDIAGTTGEFALALQKKMLSLGLDREFVNNSIYTIPKSSLCYELTRKMYDMLGLNVDNIATEFNAFDLLNVKTDNKIDYEKINNLLKQNKPFNTISLSDEPEQGDKKVEFNAVIGNPPYQDTTLGDNKGYAPPIYHNFIDVCCSFAPQVELIHPARFLFNAGSTPKDWNKKMLEDKHFKVISYWADCSSVFPNVDIQGGIAVTYRNINEDFGTIGTFTSYKQLNSISGKVINRDDFISFSSITLSRTSYRLTDKMHEDHPEAITQLSNGHPYDMSTNIFERLPQIFFNEKPNDGKKYIQIYGRENNIRLFKYINAEYVNTVVNLNFYKIFVPKSNGSGAIGEVSSTPVIGQPTIGQPMVGHTESFISIGKFDNAREAEACLKYVKSKFARCMLGILKVTQDNPPDRWQYVPLQDFTENSDIDWSKSVAEIDQQLYAKYSLTPDEIAFVESMIKPME